VDAINPVSKNISLFPQQPISVGHLPGLGTSVMKEFLRQCVRIPEMHLSRNQDLRKLQANEAEPDNEVQYLYGSLKDIFGGHPFSYFL
jgi:hypothetical protein